MSDTDTPAPGPAPGSTPEPASLDQQIDSLNQSALNFQALADRARAKGDFARAQELSAQAVALGGQLNHLRVTRRGEAIQSNAWKALTAHMDALNAEAKQTEGKMQSAEDNLETAKTIVGLVGKLTAML